MAKIQTERYRHNTQLQASMVSGTVSAPTVNHVFLAETVVDVGDIIMVAQLPERSTILQLEMVCSALGAGITADVGMMNEDETDLENNWIEGASLAAEKWFKAGDNLVAARRAKVYDEPRTIAIKITAGGTIAKDSFIGVTPWYRHANNDE